MTSPSCLQSIRNAAILVAALGALAPPPARASMRMPDDLNYAEIASPDGRVVFALDPSQPNGAGPSAVTATVDGAQTGNATLPFTFWRAEAIDSGLLAGFGYAGGFMDSKGEIVAAVVDAHGAVMSDRRRGRIQPNIPDTSPTSVRECRIDAVDRRMILVLDDENLDSARVRLWVVPFDASAEAVELRPFEVLAPGTAERPILDGVVPIAGSPLLALAWSTPGEGWRQRVPHLALIDVQRTVHWQSDAGTGRFRFPDSPAAPLQFTAHLDGTKEEITFAVSDESGTWTAREVSRRPSEWAEPPAPPTPFNRPPKALEAPAPAPFPEVTPALLGTIRLQFAAETGSPIRVGKYPRSFAIDEKGRFAFVRREPETELAVLSPEGKLLKSVSLRSLADAKLAVRGGVAYAGEGQYVITVRDSDQQARSAAHPCVVDSNSGAVRVLEEIDLWGVSDLSAGNGVFVYHGWKESDINAGDVAAVHDVEGKLLWSIGKLDTGRPHPQFAPQDVAVLSDGRIALLCKFPDAVYLFDQAGNRTATWNLQEAWGRKPNYISDLFATRDGGVIVGDFNGNPPMVRMAADGKVAAELTPPERFLVPDFAGNFWYTDEYTFRRLDAAMQTDKVVGHVPSTEEVGDLAASAVAPDGTIYLMARRTNAIHVFAPDGTKLRTIQPDPEDTPGQSDHQVDYRIMPRFDGTFALTVKNHLAEYDADGKRTGAFDLALAGFSPDIATRPDGSTWALEYRSIKLFDRDGAVKKELLRDSNRRWLRGARAPMVAGDGSLLVFGGSLSWLFGSDAGPAASAFTPDGEPRSCFRVLEPIEQFAPCAYGAGLLVSATKEGIFAMREDGTPAFRFVATHPDGREASWRPFIAAEGNELWLHDGADTIMRYAMP